LILISFAIASTDYPVKVLGKTVVLVALGMVDQAIQNSIGSQAGSWVSLDGF